MPSVSRTSIRSETSPQLVARLERLERATAQLGLSLHAVAGTDRLRRTGRGSLADLIDEYEQHMAAKEARS